MSQELLKRARDRRFFQRALLELAVELPQDDEALDRLIAEAVAARDNDAFVRIVFAALGSGRRVDARHLEDGSSLFDGPDQLASGAMHFSGDVPRALIGAVQRERLSDERSATALLLAAVWCGKNGNVPVPPELVAQARLHARRAGDNPIVDLQLAVLSELLQDEGLFEVLEAAGIPPAPGVLKDNFISGLIDPVRHSPMGIVPEQPGPTVHSGYTMRRAVARIGRNDPCPCGSGKKYKKCCMEKDQERLQESSSVAGLTVEELREQRERFLTEDQLLRMRSYELARLDPVKIVGPLRPLLIDRLNLFGELEAAVRVFEETGVPADLSGYWRACVDAVARSQRKDLMVRLLNLRDESQSTAAGLPIGAHLLLADRSDALETIEKAALAGLKNPDDDESIELAYALMEGRWPALGILVGRGLVAFKSLFESEVLLEVLLETRDKLNLSPKDPLQPVLDRRFEESIEAHRDSEVLREAHERLEIKNRELSDARSKLARMQAELEKKEGDAEPPRAVAALPAAAPRPAIDEAAVHELRRRVASLKEELKERHTERNQLRRELNSALQHLEELRQKETAAAETEGAERIEESLLDEPEPMGIQPVRIPEFSQKFLESLEDLPLTAVRHAMSLIGRLAAGDSGAFVGIKRLKANREIVRQRASDYRLLFRLHPKTIELLALIPRRDLERKIKSLAAM